MHDKCTYKAVTKKSDIVSYFVIHLSRFRGVSGLRTEIIPVEPDQIYICVGIEG